MLEMQVNDIAKSPSLSLRKHHHTDYPPKYFQIHTLYHQKKKKHEDDEEN